MTTTVDIQCADVLEWARTYQGEPFSAILTDPPYGLSKTPDTREVLEHWLRGDDYNGASDGLGLALQIGAIALLVSARDSVTAARTGCVAELAAGAAVDLPGGEAGVRTGHSQEIRSVALLVTLHHPVAAYVSA